MSPIGLHPFLVLLTPSVSQLSHSTALDACWKDPRASLQRQEKAGERINVSCPKITLYSQGHASVIQSLALLWSLVENTARTSNSFCICNADNPLQAQTVQWFKRQGQYFLNISGISNMKNWDETPGSTNFPFSSESAAILHSFPCISMHLEEG